MPSREDLELYVTGNFDGDVAALETAIADDPALAALVAEEARFETLLRDAAAAAAFCPACDELVRGERCEECGAAVKPGGYNVERVLVSNAHGRMYLARDADGTQVALKELAFVQPPSPAALAAFEREAKFLRALDHPAIPRFVASFEEGRGVHTRYYLAQELVSGTPLDRIDDHWYSEAEVVDIAKQVLAILIYLQSLSPIVIHRDIKPANLIRRGDGTIALVDFGAAYMPGTTIGLTTVGTFGYMPIEQLAGIVDATTDLYALGASLLYLLTRQEPWRLERSNVAVNVSRSLRAFLDKLAASDARDRFQSAKAALAALERPTSRTRSRRWPLLAAAITLGVAGIGGGTFALLHRSSRSDETSASPPLGSSLHVDKLVSWSFKDVKLHDALGTLAKTCGLNIVVPGYVDARVSIDLNEAPCGKAIETLLEAHRLWYVHDVAANLIRIGSRSDLEREAPRPASVLPAGRLIGLDLKRVPLRDALRMIADSGNGQRMNIVVPETVDGTITITADKVPWERVFEAVLATHDLWYTYREQGRLIAVAPRADIEPH